MLSAHVLSQGQLVQLPAGADLHGAMWIDLYRPDLAEGAALAALGVEVPTLEDMEEIEISNRLYREEDVDYMTVILPGITDDGAQISGPVTFILTPERMVTVRHHVPRPFRTFATRAHRSSAGCGNHHMLFLGLVEEVVARQADLLEGSGKVLDSVAAQVFQPETARRPRLLETALQTLGGEGEAQGRVRLGLLTLERMLSMYGIWLDGRPDAAVLRPLVKGLMRDLQALELHADFLGSRLGLISDMTLGMVNLSQNATVRIVSVVAALFLPPTLIASAYGMNFRVMPELAWPLGYPMALGLMVGSAALTYLYFRWKGWL